MNFSKQLKKHREDKKLSQEALAEKIYVTRQTISKWENDKTYPDIHNLIALSLLFEISLDELVKGDQNEMKNIKDIYRYKEIYYLSSILIILSLFFMIIGRRLFGEIFSLFMGILILIILITSRLLLRKIEKENGLKTSIITLKTANKVLTILENHDMELLKVQTKKERYKKVISYMLTVSLFLLFIFISSYVSKIL